MLTKRLFKHYSFIIILLSIPMLIPIANIAMSKDGGMVTVAVYAKSADEASNQIISNLLSEKSIVRYRLCDTEAAAISLVEEDKADCAWIFPENLKENLIKYGAGERKRSVVDIIQKEDSVFLSLTREKLFGFLFKYISYGTLEDYVYNNISSEQEISKEELYNTYANTNDFGSIIEIKRLGSGEKVGLDKSFLIAPIKGLLSLVVMLCTLAAAMWFLKDAKDGKFDWLAPEKRLLPAFGSCFAASSVSCVVILIAAIMLNFNANIAYEIISSVLYAFSSAGFCLVLCVLFRSPSKLGAAIPFFMILMLALCPVFFNFNVLKPVQFALPPYYYLNSVYNHTYIIYMVLYCIIIYVLAFVLNHITNLKD